MDGILVVNKDAGMTSHDVVNKVRRITKERRCGHSGTLDPMASGVLVVCMGKSTRLVRFMMDGSKKYAAEVTLGTATDSGDADGQITTISEPFEINKQSFLDAVNSFVGTIEQLPPMVSAVHHNGKRLYEYAREGIEVERTPREVTIYSIETVCFEELPDVLRNGDVVTLIVECSKGTYIRTLACDICESLGISGHLSKLTRIENSGFKISDAVRIEELSQLADAGCLDKVVLSPLTAVRQLKKVMVDEDGEKLVSHGAFIPFDKLNTIHEKFSEGENISIVDTKDKLIAIGEVGKGQTVGSFILKPVIVFI